MKQQFSEKSKARPEIAFYYPNQYFRDPNWAKNLILFFDGIGMLIPNYMKDHYNLDDHTVITALKEHQLFHVIEPETAVNKDATLELVTIMTEIITSGALDKLNSDGMAFGSISSSRLGFYGDPELAQMIFEELKDRGLAKNTTDGGHSIPIHWAVRSLILFLLAHILRPQGQKRGLDLSPATDCPELVEALGQLVSISASPTLNDVVVFDMNTVGVDLRTVPIDEVLAFRMEHYSEHRNSSLCVRKFVRELGQMESKEQVLAFEARREELDSIASDLCTRARKTWKKPASFCLGLAGAAWTSIAGNPLGGLLAAARTLAGSGGSDKVEKDVYSYLFSAHSRFA